MSDANDLDRWTLHELATRVALALVEGYGGQSSGRVSDVPNPRTLRYYNTLGILDRPAELRGRTAFYGRRHLAQIVAIKRLQAQGMALSDIQVRLHGLADSRLDEIARVPAAALERDLGAPRAEEAMLAEGAGAGPSFWRATPVAAPPQTEAPPSALKGAPLDWRGLALGEAILMFAPPRPLDDDDREALRAAAAPLLQLLETRGLVKPPTQEKP